MPSVVSRALRRSLWQLFMHNRLRPSDLAIAALNRFVFCGLVVLVNHGHAGSHVGRNALRG